MSSSNVEHCGAWLRDRLAVIDCPACSRGERKRARPSVSRSVIAYGRVTRANRKPLRRVGPASLRTPPSRHYPLEDLKCLSPDRPRFVWSASIISAGEPPKLRLAGVGVPSLSSATPHGQASSTSWSSIDATSEARSKKMQRVCDGCGQKKDVSGGATCSNGHFFCSSCKSVKGIFVDSKRTSCPVCKSPLR